MKITRRQLRRLILEVINTPESIRDWDDSPETPGWYLDIVDAIDTLSRNDERLFDLMSSVKDYLDTPGAMTLAGRTVNEDTEMVSGELDLSLPEIPPRGSDPEWDDLQVSLTRNMEIQPSINPSARNAILALAYHAYKAGGGKPGVYFKGKF